MKIFSRLGILCRLLIRFPVVSSWSLDNKVPRAPPAMGTSSSFKPATALARWVHEELSKVANTTNATQMQAYAKTDMPMFGVRKPARRKIEMKMYQWIQVPTSHVDDDDQQQQSTEIRKKKKNEWTKTLPLPLYQEYVQSLWQLPHREEKYLALDLAIYCPNCIVLDSLPLYESILREDYMWWDLCDPIATNLILTLYQRNRVEMEPILRRLI